MGKIKEYALYKGDKFIDIGTKEYLAKLLNVRKETIEFYASPTQLKRNKIISQIKNIKQKKRKDIRKNHKHIKI